MKKFAERDADIVAAYLGASPPTLRELGDRYGISSQRVSRIIGKVTGTPYASRVPGARRNKVRDAALAAGERFFVSKPCRRCGSKIRYVSTSGCPTCAIALGCARYAAMTDAEKRIYNDRSAA
jgi:hypothetical protein